MIVLTKVVPLRKQLGFLNMFSQLIDVLGIQASQHLPRLLEILFYCLRICRDSLEQRDKVRDSKDKCNRILIVYKEILSSLLKSFKVNICLFTT